MGKVTITADENGNVIKVSQNPEIGYISLFQETDSITDKGWLKLSRRSALLLGKMEDLIKMNYKENQELEGKIIIKESLVPFNLENPDKNLKIAGLTGLPCTLDDQPIYRNSFYTLDMSSQDELIQHSNSEEIKEVFAAQKSMTGGLNALVQKAKQNKEANLA